ncbi:putative carbon monoxide dehydrogenase accessory protein [Methanocella paludicola SANAE]|uniref:Carbon monoxide dehydrogenase accessory protein n=1 Tax=Methanocella paludicola (strain DSM 17711 / JCM 13418 / NBRC 101707 / SANAE) TaxID=304371 RepID=D1YXH3_METPS|nr:P-loop NTPase [Methanocella paludicola]BAI61145.1 putative carbon monoxide dehydrogenase accessory protein [Methanocella paludicola SANAE]
MKIAVCGKGGSGKSTISALLARAMAARGHNVLVVDLDESNYGLHRQLGMEAPADFIGYFGGKEAATKKIVEYYQDRTKEPFDMKWSIATLPSGYVVVKCGIRLLSIGKIHDFGEGCACTMGSLSELLFKNLVLDENDVVIADTEAGVEHLGRGIEAGFDHIMVVVDPSYESLRLSRKIEAMVGNNGAKVHFVLNKMDEEIQKLVLGWFEGKSVAAVIPEDRGLFRATLEGRELDMEIPAIRCLADSLY